MDNGGAGQHGRPTAHEGFLEPVNAPMTPQRSSPMLYRSIELLQRDFNARHAEVEEKGAELS